MGYIDTHTGTRQDRCKTEIFKMYQIRQTNPEHRDAISIL